MLYGEMRPPGGSDPAALGLRLYDRQPAAVLPQWRESGKQPDLPAGLAHGGAHRRRPVCEYYILPGFTLIFVFSSPMHSLLFIVLFCLTIMHLSLNLIA